MKKLFLILITAISIGLTVNAQQIQIPFEYIDGAWRGTITDPNQQIIPATVATGTIYVDVVKERVGASNAIMGVEGWTGQNSWSFPSGYSGGSSPLGQFVVVSQPGLYTNHHGGPLLGIRVNFLSDPFVTVDGSVNPAKKHLTDWKNATNDIVIEAGNLVELNLNSIFIPGWNRLYKNGVQIGQNNDYYAIESSGNYKLSLGVEGNSYDQDIYFQVIITPSTHTISASAGANGTISPSGAVSVAHGANQTFTFQPAPDYGIDQVVVDGEVVEHQGNSYTLTNITANRTIHVSFTNCKISTFPYLETFEDNSTKFKNCWIWDIMPGFNLNWNLQYDANAHSGVYYACAYQKSDAWLTMPPMDLSGQNNPVLKFWHKQSANSSPTLRVTYKASANAPSWAILQTYTGNVSTWTERTIMLPNPSNEYYIQFWASGDDASGIYCIDDVSIINLPTPPTITTTSLPNGAVGAAYSQTLTATGDSPISWSLESGNLPAGLTLSTGGIISGTPATGGAFNFTVKATNAAGSNTKALGITIATPPVIITGILPNGTVGTAYSQTLTATGTPPITWLASAGLPNGLTLSAGGVLSGTPTAIGSFNFTIMATNAAGTDSKSFTIAVSKGTQTAPGAPTKQSSTPTGITLVAVSGCEYNVNGGAWQPSPEFAGLAPNTLYTFTQRRAETTTHLPSAASDPASFGTDKALLTGDATITGNGVFGGTLTVNTAGLTSAPEIPTLGALSYQWRRGYSTLISGATNATYTLVQADIGQWIYVLVTAENCNGTMTVLYNETITKAPQEAPAKPLLESNTTESIALVAVSGCEYSINSGAWQPSPFFGGLTPNTSYSFTQRKAETATHFASATSVAAQFSTQPLGVGAHLLGSISIFPNPTTGEVRIESGELRIMRVDIFDVYGRELLSHASSMPPETTVDISHFSSGVYFVKVTTEAGEVVRKVLKE